MEGWAGSSTHHWRASDVIDNPNAIKELRKLSDSLQRVKEKVGRKMIRPSEKAMWLADIQLQIDALDFAVGTLRAVTTATKSDSFIDGVIP
jgi:hypothetical protein